MLMDCSRVRKWIPVALDGELDPMRQAHLDAHVAACPACRSELNETTRLFAALSAMPTEREVPAAVEYATIRAIRQLPQEAATSWWRTWFGWPVPALALAASVAVVAIRLLQAPPIVLERTVKAGRTTAPVVARSARPEGQIANRRPTQPLPALEEAPDVFAELELLRNLEKLRHFDDIRTTQLDGEPGVPAHPPGDGG